MLISNVEFTLMKKYPNLKKQIHKRVTRTKKPIKITVLSCAFYVSIFTTCIFNANSAAHNVRNFKNLISQQAGHN
jgi:hypothetical protein